MKIISLRTSIANEPQSIIAELRVIIEQNKELLKQSKFNNNLLRKIVADVKNQNQDLDSALYRTITFISSYEKKYLDLEKKLDSLQSEKQIVSLSENNEHDALIPSVFTVSDWIIVFIIVSGIIYLILNMNMNKYLSQLRTRIMNLL